ncbi:MAG: hypothetical protein H6541_04760 [Lentimicrobiaceae bacterium]|nr:hypothetical protein [Lentimicrobiaceae bacterium]MCB9024480.1 hypothetical protein [Lentimicrobiaceae bacterium]MCO5265156.1 hypothetical protein [Lentimicrobium sp.]HPG33864.1 hypothetical protein [Lentimicrobium sp.]
MATYIHFLDPHSKDIEEVINNLEPTPGTCIFIDMINSTGDKILNPDKSWIRKANNTFNFISVINQFPNYVVKGIGDEMMLFLPDVELEKSETFRDYLSLLGEIHATIDTLINHPLKNLFYECKVGIHYCTDVYNITFFEGVNDYYGTDIDASARLMQKSKGNRIVISEQFYNKVLDNIQTHGLDKNQTVVSNISDIYIEDFKGIPTPFKYRMIHL